MAFNGFASELKGFYPFDFHLGTPSMSITERGVTFNTSTVKRIGAPEYVQLLVNYSTKQVAVRMCEPGAENAERFVRSAEKRSAPVRWNKVGLLDMLSRMWDIDLANGGYRVKGEQVDGITVLFDFGKAVKLG